MSFKELRERCWESLAPVGRVEEMLVERIVTAQWRLRRVLMAETGEIVLSVDGGVRHQAERTPTPLPLGRFMSGSVMRRSRWRSRRRGWII